MKKSTIVTLLVFLLLIPLTIYFGTKLPGRSYYITSTLIIIEMLIPFFLAFEGRKPQARELVLIAMLCAIAIASRVAIPIPHFKPTLAIIMLAGVAFGPETGFMVGAITAFGSNFFAGQGAHTPWQMMGYGAGGLLCGFLTQKGWLKRSRWLLGVVGFCLCILCVGPLMDISAIFIVSTRFSWKMVLALLASGFPINVSLGISTFLTMVLLSKALLDKLDRIKLKYGMTGKPEDT